MLLVHGHTWNNTVTTVATLDGVVRKASMRRWHLSSKDYPGKVKSWPRQTDQQHHGPGTSKSLTYWKKGEEVWAAGAQWEMGVSIGGAGVWSLFWIGRS